MMVHEKNQKGISSTSLFHERSKHIFLRIVEYRLRAISKSCETGSNTFFYNFLTLRDTNMLVNQNPRQEYEIAASYLFFSSLRNFFLHNSIKLHSSNISSKVQACVRRYEINKCLKRKYLKTDKNEGAVKIIRRNNKLSFFTRSLASTVQSKFFICVLVLYY